MASLLRQPPTRISRTSRSSPRYTRVRASLADFLRVPKRWNGLLRRTSTARAIQGSNTIEGYTVSDEDAVAAVDDEPPLTADEATWAEIVGLSTRADLRSQRRDRARVS